MADSLRDRLATAGPDGYDQFFDEPLYSADTVVEAFAAWLRERADGREDLADTDRPSRYHEWRDRAEELRSAADELDPPKGN